MFIINTCQNNTFLCYFLLVNILEVYFQFNVYNADNVFVIESTDTLTHNVMFPIFAVVANKQSKFWFFLAQNCLEIKQ